MTVSPSPAQNEITPTRNQSQTSHSHGARYHTGWSRPPSHHEEGRRKGHINFTALPPSHHLSFTTTIQSLLKPTRSDKSKWLPSPPSSSLRRQPPGSLLPPSPPLPHSPSVRPTPTAPLARTTATTFPSGPMAPVRSATPTRPAASTAPPGRATATGSAARDGTRATPGTFAATYTVPSSTH